jgi:hypothetical protein
MVVTSLTAILSELSQEAQGTFQDDHRDDSGPTVEAPHVVRHVAARIVNKEYAQHGGSTMTNALSINEFSAGRRGGLRSLLGPGGHTLLQLRNEAPQRGLKGCFTMDKAQLQLALHR